MRAEYEEDACVLPSMRALNIYRTDLDFVRADVYLNVRKTGNRREMFRVFPRVPFKAARRAAIAAVGARLDGKDAKTNTITETEEENPHLIKP